MDAYTSRISVTPSAGERNTRTAGYFLLSWVITWGCALPTALAWMQHSTPSPLAVAGAGLSAFGPLLAALTFAARTGNASRIFKPFRAAPALTLLALAAPFIIHTIATALYAALGGHPSAWIHPPSTPEQLAALVVFPLGEEFGWRGFAYPRLVERHGLVKGSLLLGIGWGLWHLAYSITPQAAGFDALKFALAMVELPLYSLLIAWGFERANRGMAVALAFHAGAHLDHIELLPRAELGLQGLHVLVLAVVAGIAARALAAQDVRRRAPPPASPLLR
ncbi:MAG TPA: CPBP family intramembrane glutamic endopeptidase [Polyangiaceae bacterium]|nr:CPBP family intramembrane glutamic endopeptidase [Polyangiaceae bacterium]